MTTLSAPAQTNGQASGQDPFDQLVPGRPPRRRNWPRVGAGVALAVASGAVFVALYASAGSRHPYLAVTRPVAAGQRITASDLATVRLTSAPSLSPIPADEASGVIGRRAAVALVPGTLLTQADLASGPVLGAGQASVGLDLKPGQVPAGLVPGAVVAVVETAAAGPVSVPVGAAPSSVTEGESLGQSPGILAARATVLSVVVPTANSATGDTEVTIAVPVGVAPGVAQAAAAGQVAVVELGSAGGAP
jgi:hypothetical protein